MTMDDYCNGQLKQDTFLNSPLNKIPAQIPAGIGRLILSAHLPL